MKILIVKTSSLGDIIQAFPVLDYLRRRFPDGHIDWVVESPHAELLRAHSQVDDVLTIDSKKWRKNPLKKNNRDPLIAFKKRLRAHHYDILFDLQGNIKSSLIVCAAKARNKVGFGWKTLAEWPNGLFTSHKFNPPKGRNIREDYLAIVKKFFNDDSLYTFSSISLKLEPLQQQKLTSIFQKGEVPTLVCPSSAWPNKCLSEEILIKCLRSINHTPYWFVWGNALEREMALRLSSYFKGSIVLERLSLPLLQHVMSKCRLVISMDSLPLHLCATTATPTLSFFGPSWAQKYAPLGEQHIRIQGKCPFGVIFEKRCPQLRSCTTGSCLKAGASIERSIEEILRSHFQP